MSFRRLKMGLNTVLGRKKQGYFIPYRYLETTPTLGDQVPYETQKTLFDAEKNTFLHYLNQIASHLDQFKGFGKAPPPEPRFEQDWFPRLDGAAAYSMVREFAPKTIIEVGSGHSTRFMLRAIKDGKLQTEFHAIDPAPRADISKLPISIDNQIVQNSDLSVFQKLQAGDILFIDSSHIAMPGSDVDYLFLNILPALPAGVVVHIHDIFLPDAYPAAWEWRGYNEQQAVAGLLTGGFEILFSSHYAAKYMADEVEKSGLGDLPLPKGAFETSLWLRKKP